MWNETWSDPWLWSAPNTNVSKNRTQQNVIHKNISKWTFHFKLVNYQPIWPQNSHFELFWYFGMFCELFVLSFCVFGQKRSLTNSLVIVAHVKAVWVWLPFFIHAETCTEGWGTLLVISAEIKQNNTYHTSYIQWENSP